MKKFLFILIALVLVSGCALMPVTRGELDKQLAKYATKEDTVKAYKLGPESTLKLLKLLEETGANKIRAFTGLTGGTSGKLDAISVDDLSTKDLGLVFDVDDTDGMYFYRFNATASESSDNSRSGVF